jgi:purine-binding chemotaxis protein CheW
MREPLPPELEAIYRERAVRLAALESEDLSQTLTLLDFSVGEERFALALTAIARILPFGGYTPVPGAVPPYKGVIHVSGEILPLAGLGEILGISGTAAEVREYILLLKAPQRQIGLQVGPVNDLTLLTSDGIRSLPKGGPYFRFCGGITPSGAALLKSESLMEALGFSRPE